MSLHATQLLGGSLQLGSASAESRGDLLPGFAPQLKEIRQ